MRDIPERHTHTKRLPPKHRNQISACLVCSNRRLCVCGLTEGAHSADPASHHGWGVSSSAFPTVCRCDHQHVPGSHQGRAHASPPTSTHTWRRPPLQYATSPTTARMSKWPSAVILTPSALWHPRLPRSNSTAPNQPVFGPEIFASETPNQAHIHVIPAR